MQLTIHPLTPDLWPALADLFGEQGAVNGCWCMYWRIGSEYRKRPREANKAAFCELVTSGPHVAPRPIMRYDFQQLDAAGGCCG